MSFVTAQESLATMIMPHAPASIDQTSSTNNSYSAVTKSVEALYAYMRNSLQTGVVTFAKQELASEVTVKSVATDLQGPMTLTLSKEAINIEGLSIGITIDISKKETVLIFPLTINCSVHAQTGAGIINRDASQAFSSGIADGLNDMASAGFPTFKGVSFAALDQAIPTGVFVFNNQDMGVYLRSNLLSLLESGPTSVTFTEAPTTAPAPSPIELLPGQYKERESLVGKTVTFSQPVLAVAFNGAGMAFKLTKNYKYRLQ